MSGLAAGRAIRVMLCDDSAVARGALRRMLVGDGGMQVVAQAADGRQAVAMLAAMPAAERPDVVLLDLEMPVMDGLTALPALLRASPRTAVIVASALSRAGAAATMAALAAGASDFVAKPSAAGGGMADPRFQAELRAKVLGWAGRRAGPAAPAVAARRPMAIRQRPRAIAIGCSTGGPQALAALVGALVRPPPVPLLVAQHMPAGFTAHLADHLRRLGRLPCAEARDGERLLPARLYLAPGDRHLLVRDDGGALSAVLSDGPAENFCRPAVDPLLRSLVAACGGAAVAAILTGMGQDGLDGCHALARAGGLVLAQDEASAVIWGMPGAVARAGLAALLAPPEQIAARLLAVCAG
jgi:two-component system chemotaxis response regulator CheB